MPRESIAMTRDELLAFLGGEQRVAIGTLEPDGRVWPDAAACALIGETFYFRIARLSRSYKNIRRDARVCASTDRFPSYYEVVGATVHGRARELTDFNELQNLRMTLDVRPDPVGGLTIGQNAYFALPLDDVASFDFAKIKKRVE